MDNYSELEGQVNKQNTDHQQSLVSKVPVIEERLKIGIRQVETGSVQIHKKVISEEVTQDVSVTSEEVHVERKVINQYVATAPAVRYEGSTTIIPVVKEVLVTEKRLMLVEEIHVTKKYIASTSTITETLRKEEIEINRSNPAQ